MTGLAEVAITPLGRVLPDCGWYPFGLDPAQRTIRFAIIGRQVYRDAGFLAPRHAALGKRQVIFNLDDLLARMPEACSACAPNYILISAFCCSTLLARYLDLVPGTHVLREPALLGQLAMLRHQQPPSDVPPGEWPQEWRQWAELGLLLLARTFAPGEVPIVKCSDVSNAIGDVLLETDARSRVLLLSVGLRTFILSVLKSAGRREWMHARARFWRGRSALLLPLEQVKLAPLDDAKRSAYLWLATELLWNALKDRPGFSLRVLRMDGEEVSDEPRMAVGSVAQHFGFPLDDSALDLITCDKTASRHAKRPGEEYDASSRRRDVADWELRYGAEADAAVAWALAFSLPASVRERAEVTGRCAA